MTAYKDKTKVRTRLHKELRNIVKCRKNSAVNILQP
jgi:hypothetical protein